MRLAGLSRAAAPLVVIAVAGALWLISDRLLYVGPLDRATFGWTVVVPIWAAAPFAAALAWRGFQRRARTLAVVACGLPLGGLAAALLWLALAFPACAPARGPVEWLPPAIVLGVVIGGGFGVNCLIASGQVRTGHPWRALVFGAVGQLAIIGLVLTIAFSLFFGVCARP
jgi:hypothetical protein